ARYAGVPGARSPRACSRRAVRRPDGQPRLLEVHPRGGAGVLLLPRTAGDVAGRPEGAHAARDHRHAEEATGVSRRRHGEARPERERRAGTGGIAPAADLRRRPPPAGFGPAGVADANEIRKKTVEAPAVSGILPEVVRFRISF